MNKNKEKFILALTEKISKGPEKKIEKKHFFLRLADRMDNRVLEIKSDRIVLDEANEASRLYEKTGLIIYQKLSTNLLRSLLVK